LLALEAEWLGAAEMLLTYPNANGPNERKKHAKEAPRIKNKFAGTPT
jgi:catalase (peroxidase I)